jgi:PAS domain S-box-containing protein
MRITLSRKAMILVAIPLTFELLFVSTLLVMMHQLDGERAREAHARELTSQLNKLLRLLLERGTAVIIHNTTDSKAYGNRAHLLAGQIDQERAVLTTLVDQSQQEMQTMSRIDALIDSCNHKVAESTELVRQGAKTEAAAIWLQLSPILNELCNEVDAAVAEQQSIQVEKKQSLAQMRTRVEIAIYAGIAFNIILAIWLTIYFNRGTSKRLDVLIDNTYRLAMHRDLSPPLDGEDELAHLDRTFRTMSESMLDLRRRETAVIEKAADIICSINVLGKFITVNPACTKQWGYAVDDLVGKHISSVIAPDDLERVLQHLTAIKQDAAAEATFDCKIRTAKGELKPASWSAHWSNEEKSTFCVIHDISERVALEQMKNDFLAMASHDLKVPLASIRMLHKMLLVGVYGPVSDQAKEKLTEAQINTERLLALIQGLLDMERLESGSLELKMEPIFVDDIIGGALKSVSGFAEQQNILLHVLSHDNVKLAVDGDKLIQVMVNLLSNAIKFSPSGETVTVAVEQTDTDLMLTVNDHGIGVPPELQNVIFEKFKTFAGANDANKSGTGLGLAICKLLIESHSGEIGLSTIAGEGTTFFVKLPVNVIVG